MTEQFIYRMTEVSKLQMELSEMMVLGTVFLNLFNFFFLDGRIKGGIPLAIHLVARLRSANFGESSIGIFEQG